MVKGIKHNCVGTCTNHFGADKRNLSKICQDYCLGASLG